MDLKTTFRILHLASSHQSDGKTQTKTSQLEME